MKQGIFTISNAEYHSDPSDMPSLSSSIVKVLDDKSPLHAWMEHPRLNPNHNAINKDKFDLGSASHALILGSDDEFVIVNPENYPAKNGNIPEGWTNDAIRAARDAVYDSGKIPLLPKQWESASDIAVSCLKAMEKNQEIRRWKKRGKPEQSMFWRDKIGISCRSRIDWMPDNPNDFFVDIKTTETSVNPELIGRYALNMGWDIQEAFYRRGLKSLGIVENAKFRFVAIEQKAPFAVTIVALPPEVQSHADEKVEQAMKIWKKCLDDNDWPGYTTDTIYIDPPAYALTRHQERWARNEMFIKECNE